MKPARWIMPGLVLLLLVACRGEHRLQGVVVDYDSGHPVPGATVTARQSGWGFSNGSLVWDKSYPYSAQTNESGRFDLTYRHGSSAHLWVEADGYQRLILWSEPAPALHLPLKKMIPDYVPQTSGHLTLGLTVDGRYYGWDFERCELVDDPAGADLIPVEMGPDIRDPMVLTTTGSGGIQCRSFSELDAPVQPLTYSDAAPVEGYRPRVTLDFRNDEGGVCFVRTRDGAHYAKFAYTPSSLGGRADPVLRRDLMIRYVYNPSGGTDLRFQEEGPNPKCGDPWSAMP